MRVQYQIIKLLGQGGCADVYLARRTDTAEQVVVKRPRDAHQPDVRKNFERELKVLLSRTPGLVDVIDWNLTTNPPFYVMPYLQGSLRAYAARLTPAQLHAVATQAATVLANLHRQSIAHGDFKPDNLLVSWEGDLRVADPIGNGLGCTFNVWQHNGGTPGYSAPEIQNGMPISTRGDAYALGATLAELLTGRTPQYREDLTLGPYGDPIIGEIITACCNPTPWLRPTMTDVLRILRGEQWATIQNERQRGQLVATCAFGLALAFAFTLAGRARA